MCRIAGIISPNPDGLYSRVKAMCDVMKHGGPDDEGIYLDSERGICLGNRRLAVQDLSRAGHQPMQAGDNSLWITFNGEIYNYKELRSELRELGHYFNSDTDTEVILKAYQHWGTSSFARLNGMFAFALVDHSTQKTFLLRDAGGIKPLYYSLHNEGLVFASEVKAFKKSGIVFSSDEHWKIYLLALGHIPEPYTTLKSVLSLPKGHLLTFNNKTHTGHIRKIFSYSYSSRIIEKAEAVAKVQEQLKLAVKSHLIADAEIGVFLSGGLDSSIVTLLANEFQGRQLNTLSIDLEETDYSEKKYQQLISRQTEGHHSDYRINYQDFKANFGEILTAMDQPSTDGINSWFVSKCAQESGLKAVLSGLGADELFGGYPSFRRTSTIKALKKLPKNVLRSAGKHPDLKYKRLFYLSYDNPLGEYLFSRGFFTPQTIADILDADVWQIDQLLQNYPVDLQFDSLNGGNRASWLELNLYMQNQLLKDVDYMSMSHGIEVRVPFLDRDLVQLVLSIDPAIKFSGLQPKSLLIDAFKYLLPEKIYKRPKMGFSFPFQEWMRTHQVVSDPAIYGNKTSAKLINRFNTDRLHWSSAFALYHVETGKW